MLTGWSEFCPGFTLDSASYWLLSISSLTLWSIFHAFCLSQKALVYQCLVGLMPGLLLFEVVGFHKIKNKEELWHCKPKCQSLLQCETLKKKLSFGTPAVGSQERPPAWDFAYLHLCISSHVLLDNLILWDGSWGCHLQVLVKVTLPQVRAVMINWYSVLCHAEGLSPAQSLKSFKLVI